jgi:hypothetical protein
VPCTGEFGSLRPRRLCPTPEMVASRTFYGRLQLLGSMATVLTAPPSGGLFTWTAAKCAVRPQQGVRREPAALPASI